MECPVCKTNIELTPEEIEVLLPSHPNLGRVLERLGRRVAANGYEIMGLTIVTPQEGIVIARQERGDSFKWVTWRFRIDECEPYWGNYCDRHSDALGDYRDRMAKMVRAEGVQQ